MSPIPSIGRIVHFQLTDTQASMINNTRREQGGWRAGSLHNNTRREQGGSLHHTGDILPMIITRVYEIPAQIDTPISGQVFLDGNDTMWVGPVELGNGPGQYSWPVCVPSLHDQPGVPSLLRQGVVTPEELAKIKARPPEQYKMQAETGVYGLNDQPAPRRDHILTDEELQIDPEELKRIRAI